jgi:hypothetical protein
MTARARAWTFALPHQTAEDKVFDAFASERGEQEEISERRREKKKDAPVERPAERILLSVIAPQREGTPHVPVRMGTDSECSERQTILHETRGESESQPCVV